MKKVFFESIGGLTLYPFIIIREDHSNPVPDSLMNHEMIHIYQQAETLVLPFYIWYLVEWCIRAIQYKSWGLGYRNISFEREAYANDRDMTYLKNRKFFSFLKYL